MVFSGALRGEWTKLRTARTTVGLSAAVLVLMPALAVLVGATLSLQPDDTVLGGSLTGAVLAQMAAGILGALVVTGEYGSGMIRVTFAARPQRVAVLAAKAVVVAGVAFVAALAGAALAYGTGSVMLGGYGYAAGEPMPALLGVAACVAAIGVLGVAVGALVRHPAAAVTAVLAVLILPELFAPLLGDLRRWVAGGAPAAPVVKLSQSSDASVAAMGGLGGWWSLALVCAYTAVVWAGAAWVLRRRDA